MFKRRLEAAYAIRGTRAALLTFMRRQYTIDGLRLLTGTYEQIRSPVLQVHGSEDVSIPVSGAKALTPRIEDVRFLLAERIGHDVHVTATAWLAAAIDRFIEDTPLVEERSADTTAMHRVVAAGARR